MNNSYTATKPKTTRGKAGTVNRKTVSLPLRDWAKMELRKRYGNYRRAEEKLGLSAGTISQVFHGIKRDKVLVRIAPELGVKSTELWQSIREGLS